MFGPRSVSPFHLLPTGIFIGRERDGDGRLTGLSVYLEADFRDIGYAFRLHHSLTNQVPELCLVWVLYEEMLKIRKAQLRPQPPLLEKPQQADSHRLSDAVRGDNIAVR